MMIKAKIIVEGEFNYQEDLDAFLRLVENAAPYIADNVVVRSEVVDELFQPHQDEEGV